MRVAHGVKDGDDTDSSDGDSHLDSSLSPDQRVLQRSMRAMSIRPSASLAASFSHATPVISSPVITSSTSTANRSGSTAGAGNTSGKGKNGSGLSDADFAATLESSMFRAFSEADK